jgi:hypothetical protein
MPTISDTTTPHQHDPAIDYARRAMARARAEIVLLAMLMESPRRGRALADELHLTADDFTDDDTSAIYVGWRYAAERDAGREWACRYARYCLRRVGAWDADETAANLANSRWSDGKLARLATRWEFDRDKAIELIGRLREQRAERRAA